MAPQKYTLPLLLSAATEALAWGGWSKWGNQGGAEPTTWGPRPTDAPWGAWSGDGSSTSSVDWVNKYTATDASDVYAAQATALSSSPTSKVPGKAFDRFVVIWLENTDYNMALADPNLAYLASKGITLSNYFSVTHPSQPNYVASVSGDNYGMDNDDFTQIPANVSSVVDLLEDRGISWGEYQEDMPFAGFEGFAWVNQETKANDYVRKHNPEIIHNSVTKSERRISQIKNITNGFYDDLAADKLPQWMFITPNMTSDGHDTSVTVAGAWTRNFLEPLLSNKNFLQNTLVLVTFDESHTYTIQNRVLGILLGDAVPEELVGTTDSNAYTHYSEIATVEANWDLHTLGRWDVGANVFSLVGSKTGDEIRPWPALTEAGTVYLNASFNGAFSVDYSPQAPIPAPNVSLVHNGRTVHPDIIRTWADSSIGTYYSDTVEIPDGNRPPARWY